MFSVNERIEKLKKETRDLRKEVKDLKETLLQQNDIIINLLSKQSGILNETIETERQMPHLIYGKKISEFSRRFPLEDMKDLKKFEAEINEDNENHIQNIVEALLAPKGLTKSISNVLSETLVMDVNVDGYHNKKRLLDYPKTIDILYQAWRKENGNANKTMFLNELRKALRMVKNRIHKNNCQARQKLREKQEQEKEQKIQTVEEFIIKTEEADFD